MKTYKKISDLLKTHRQWCKYRLSNNRGRYCLIGAIDRVCRADQTKKAIIIHKICKYIKKLDYYSISAFNDDNKTKFKDIQKLVKELKI